MKEVGSNVHGFKVEDRVGVGAYLDSCRECEYCNERLEVYCSKGALYTINGLMWMVQSRREDILVSLWFMKGIN